MKLYPYFIILFILIFVHCQKQPSQNWYESSFYLLHLDHHTREDWEVGKQADLQETARLLALSKPDVIQIHAKGNPGWTTYSSSIGFVPPKLANDVMDVWSRIAERDGYHFSVYYNIGRDGEIMERFPQWNRININDKLIDRAICYHSGVAEEYLWPMIEEILNRYSPDGFWFDGSCFTVANCYCTKCQQRFQDELGLKLPHDPSDPGWDEFKEMQRQIYREFIHQTCEKIKEKNPDCLVSFNFAYSLFMPEKPGPLIDYLTGDREIRWIYFPVLLTGMTVRKNPLI